MLVEHDVEAELVAQEPLVVIAVKKIGRDPGIEMAVRQRPKRTNESEIRDRDGSARFPDRI
jgi:hypothetical protein